MALQLQQAAVALRCIRCDRVIRPHTQYYAVQGTDLEVYYHPSCALDVQTLYAIPAEQFLLRHEGR
jgi:hypothetical protein